MKECISDIHMFSFSSPYQDLGMILNQATKKKHNNDVVRRMR